MSPALYKGQTLSIHSLRTRMKPFSVEFSDEAQVETPKAIKALNKAQSKLALFFSSGKSIAVTSRL